VVALPQARARWRRRCHRVLRRDPLQQMGSVAWRVADATSPTHRKNLMQRPTVLEPRRPRWLLPVRTAWPGWRGGLSCAAVGVCEIAALSHQPHATVCAWAHRGGADGWRRQPGAGRMAGSGTGHDGDSGNNCNAHVGDPRHKPMQLSAPGYSVVIRMVSHDDCYPLQPWRPVTGRRFRMPGSGRPRIGPPTPCGGYRRWPDLRRREGRVAALQLVIRMPRFRCISSPYYASRTNPRRAPCVMESDGGPLGLHWRSGCWSRWRAAWFTRLARGTGTRIPAAIIGTERG